MILTLVASSRRTVWPRRTCEGARGELGLAAASVVVAVVGWPTSRLAVACVSECLGACPR